VNGMCGRKGPLQAAAVEEAHRQGKPAFAHPTNPEGLLGAVCGGVGCRSPHDAAVRFRGTMRRRNAEPARVVLRPVLGSRILDEL